MAVFLAQAPVHVGTIDQSFFIEPLGGSQKPISYLDRFPDDLYNKSPETHFVRFMYALLGPVGLGRIRKEYLNTRLLIEAKGLSLFDLDDFFHNPFAFGRIFEEIYDPPNDLLIPAKWAQIKQQDQAYASRAFEFMRGVRAGNSPLGMKHVAQAGLGSEVEIIENYKAMWDAHAFIPQGYTYYGTTGHFENGRFINASPAEMLVAPQRELTQSQVQTVTFEGQTTGGNWFLSFRGFITTVLDWDASPYAVQVALNALPSIGTENVAVSGGPGPHQPYEIQFIGALSGDETLPKLQAFSNLVGITPQTQVKITIATNLGLANPVDETAQIPQRDLHSLQSALDAIKPVGVLPTVIKGSGIVNRQEWQAIHASSEYHEVIPFITGNAGISWPTPDDVSWIQANIEKEAPRLQEGIQHHYESYHQFASVRAYMDLALQDANYELDASSTDLYSSVHSGLYTQAQINAFPFFAQFVDPSEVFSPSRVEVGYANLLVFEGEAFNTQTQATSQLLDGVYPDYYLSLPGVPPLIRNDHFLWSSLARESGSEFLEIDLGEPKAVNHIAFETTYKPTQINISYDCLDMTPERSFITPAPVPFVDYPDQISHVSGIQTPWTLLNFFIQDAFGNIPITRYIRIEFLRVQSNIDPFFFDPTTSTQYPWTIDVRNLRIGRNVVD